jgi:hypothetical protein
VLAPRGFFHVSCEVIFELYGERCHDGMFADYAPARNPRNGRVHTDSRSWTCCIQATIGTSEYGSG